jgi:hypothetical protein
MRLFFLAFLGLLISACGSTQGISSTMNKTEDLSTGEGKYIISAPIIEKSFVQKKGNNTEFIEYYVQRSVQDYFIKFCEGKVTVAELEKHLKKQKGDIKSLTLEIEIKDGLWDSCDENNMVQSRTGEYIIIHRIVEE